MTIFIKTHFYKLRRTHRRAVVAVVVAVAVAAVVVAVVAAVAVVTASARWGLGGAPSRAGRAADGLGRAVAVSLSAIAFHSCYSLWLCCGGSRCSGGMLKVPHIYIYIYIWLLYMGALLYTAWIPPGDSLDHSKLIYFSLMQLCCLEL